MLLLTAVFRLLLYSIHRHSATAYTKEHTAASTHSHTHTHTHIRSVVNVDSNYTTRDAILTCAQKLTWVSLIYQTEPKTKKWRTEKLKMDMLQSIGKQSRESTEWVRKKKRKATVGRICRKKGFKTGMKEREVTDDEWWASEQFQKRPECIHFITLPHNATCVDEVPV